MGTEERPNSEYTSTWSPSGAIEFAALGDGTRLRYLKTGFSPRPLILLHTVRTQLDHFQLVIPRLLRGFTVYAVDLPGMGWSDITPGASYNEPALRNAFVEFVQTLDLSDVTLVGESMGATVSLAASTELEDRVRGVVAFNPYDYPQGVGRAIASPPSTSAPPACRSSALWSPGRRTSPSWGESCEAVCATGASSRISTSPSCAGSAVVADTRAWRARSTATSTA